MKIILLFTLSIMNQNSIFAKFQHHRDSKRFCDIVIKVEEAKFPCHKLLLASCSDYFEAMFSTDMVEKHLEEIEIKEIASCAFNQCLDFMYSNEVHLSCANVEDIMLAACLLQLWDLRRKCAQFMEIELSPDNCIEMYSLSLVYDLHELESSSKRLILKHFGSLIEDNNILHTISPAIWKMVLESNKLSINDERILLNALMQWINEDYYTRTKYFCQLFQLIRLPLLTIDYFQEIVMKIEHISTGNCNDCNKHILQMNNNLGSRRQHKLNSDLSTKRELIGNRVLLVSETLDDSIAIFDFTDSSFNRLMIPKLPMKVDFPASSISVINNKIFAVGTSDTNNSFFCDFLKDNKWQELRPNHHHHSCANEASTLSHNNMIYVIGGQCNGRYMATMESFNTITKTWSKLQDMNVPRSDVASVIHHNSAFVIGGWDGEQYLSAVEKYDSENNKWEVLPSLIERRSSAVAESFKDKVFALSGFAGHYLSSIESFRIGDSSWSYLKNLNVERFLPGTCVIGEKLHVFGGVRSRGAMCSLYESWNEDQNKWEESETTCNDIMGCRIFELN